METSCFRKRKHRDEDFCETREDGSSAVESSESKRKKILIENQRAMYQVASEVMKNEASTQKLF